MPTPDEVQAALDALFVSGGINQRLELNMWDEAKRQHGYSFFDALRFRRPPRLHAGWTKQQCDDRFRQVIELVLAQAEKVRQGKKAIDVYPPTAVIIMIQVDNYGDEPASTWLTGLRGLPRPAYGSTLARRRNS